MQKTSVKSGEDLFHALKQIFFDFPLKLEVVSQPVIGLTQDSTSLVKWSLYGLVLSQLTQDFNESRSWEEGTDVFHHDEGKKQSSNFAQDVRTLIDVIRNKGNPFLHLTDLVNLNGEISENSQSVFELEKIGQNQYSEFVQKVIVERTVSLDNPINKNNILIFKIKASRKPQTKKLQFFKCNASLFSRMYIASDKREGDLETFLHMKHIASLLQWPTVKRKCTTQISQPLWNASLMKYVMMKTTPLL